MALTGGDVGQLVCPLSTLVSVWQRHPEKEAGGAVLSFLGAPYTRTNSNWIKDPQGKAETIEVLEENMRENFHDSGFGHGFFGDTKSES